MTNDQMTSFVPDKGLNLPGKRIAKYLCLYMTMTNTSKLQEHLDMFRCYNRNMNFLTEFFLLQITLLQFNTWKSTAKANNVFLYLFSKNYSEIEIVIIKQNRSYITSCFRETRPSQVSLSSLTELGRVIQSHWKK